MRRRRALMYLLAAPVGFAATALVARYLTTTAPQPGASIRGQDTDRPLPVFTLPGLVDGEAGLSSSDFSDGVTVLNLFASWCVPCLAEHPFITRLARDEGVTVHGIAWMDEPADTVRWLAQNGSPYTRVGMDRSGTLRRALGVEGVPMTYIVDSDGRIRFTRAGPLVADNAIEDFLTALTALRS